MKTSTKVIIGAVVLVSAGYGVYKYRNGKTKKVSVQSQHSTGLLSYPTYTLEEIIRNWRYIPSMDMDCGPGCSSKGELWYKNIKLTPNTMRNSLDFSYQSTNPIGTTLKTPVGKFKHSTNKGWVHIPTTQLKTGSGWELIKTHSGKTLIYIINYNHQEVISKLKFNLITPFGQFMSYYNTDIQRYLWMKLGAIPTTQPINRVDLTMATQYSWEYNNNIGLVYNDTKITPDTTKQFIVIGIGTGIIGYYIKTPVGYFDWRNSNWVQLYTI